MALDKNVKTFVIHVTFIRLNKPKISIHLARKAKIASLIAEEIKILTKYSDVVNVFSEKKALVLLEQIDFNKHVIKLKNSKQLSYGLIYSLGLVKLEILKTYIETHPKTGFIWLFQPSTGASILFDKKPDSSFQLCVDY